MSNDLLVSKTGDDQRESQISAFKALSNETSNYYFIDHDKKYEQIQPSFGTDVIRLYDLLNISQSLTRTNPDGSKGVKLRKSYKSHISDLPGKHMIPSDKTLSNIVLVPENPDMIDPDIDPFKIDYLKNLFNFEKSSMNGIPGFDSSKLALDNIDGETGNKKEKKRKNGASNTPEQPDFKKRHVQVSFD